MKYDTSFLLLFVTIISGLIVFVLRTVFASKCRSVQLFWGCVTVDRDVDIEMSDIRQSPGRANRNESSHIPHLQLPRRSIPRSSSPVSVVDLEKLDYSSEL